MAGTAVLRIAENHPGFYRAVGSYSGCADTASPTGQLLLRNVAMCFDRYLATTADAATPRYSRTV